MPAACSYWPARSSSKPWPMTWAGNERAARSATEQRASNEQGRFTGQCRVAASAADSGQPGRIQSPEILEHQATLLGSETLELLPRGVAEPRARARRPGFQDVGDVNAVPGRGAADALLGLVGLVVRERAARVEQSAVQPLLAREGLLVEAPGLELTRKLFRLLRQWSGGGARASGLEPLELLRKGALAGGQGAESLQHRLAAQAHQRHQTLRQPVQPLLIARQARQLLHRFGEPAPRLPAGDLAAAAGQRQGGGVEGVEGVLGERSRLGGIGVGFFELGARRRHLPLRIAQRRVELR